MAGNRKKEELRKLLESEEEEHRNRECSSSSVESANTGRDVNNSVNAEGSARASSSQDRPVTEPLQFIVNIPERNQKYVGVRVPAPGRMNPTAFPPVIGSGCTMLRCPQHRQVRPAFRFPAGERNVRNVLTIVPPEFPKRVMMASGQRNPTSRPQGKRAKLAKLPPLIKLDPPGPASSSKILASGVSNMNMLPQHHLGGLPPSAASAVFPARTHGELDDLTKKSAGISLERAGQPEILQVDEFEASISREINDNVSASAAKALKTPDPCYFMFSQTERGELPSTSGANEIKGTPVAAPMAHTNSSVDVKFSIAKILGKEDDSNIPNVPLDLRVTHVTQPARNVRPVALPVLPARNTQQEASPTVPTRNMQQKASPVVPAGNVQPGASPNVPVRNVQETVLAKVPARNVQRGASLVVPAGNVQQIALPKVPARNVQPAEVLKVPARKVQPAAVLNVPARNVQPSDLPAVPARNVQSTELATESSTTTNANTPKEDRGTSRRKKSKPKKLVRN